VRRILATPGKIDRDLFQLYHAHRSPRLAENAFRRFAQGESGTREKPGDWMPWSFWAFVCDVLPTVHIGNEDAL
jgi:hypothetical protein